MHCNTDRERERDQGQQAGGGKPGHLHPPSQVSLAWCALILSAPSSVMKRTSANPEVRRVSSTREESSFFSCGFIDVSKVDGVDVIVEGTRGQVRGPVGGPVRTTSRVGTSAAASHLILSQFFCLLRFTFTFFFVVPSSKAETRLLPIEMKPVEPDVSFLGNEFVSYVFRRYKLNYVALTCLHVQSMSTQFYLSTLECKAYLGLDRSLNATRAA